MEEETHTGKKRSVRTLMILGGLGMTLLVVLTLKYLSVSKIPVINIPSPNRPTPNAFNTFNLATTLMLDDKKIGDALSTSAPSSKTYNKTVYSC